MPKTRLITADELFAMGEGRRELVRGEVVEMSPTGGDHGEILGELSHRLWLSGPREHGLRVFSGDVGFLLERDPDTVRAPDVAVVRTARLEGLDRRKFLPLAPDLVVEIVSPNDRFPEVEAKAAMWLDAGSEIVWVVEPSSRRVLVHRPDRPREERAGDDRLTGGTVFPAFSVAARELFETVGSSSS